MSRQPKKTDYVSSQIVGWTNWVAFSFLLGSVIVAALTAIVVWIVR